MLQALLGQLGQHRPNEPPADNPKHPDTSETVYISSLALLKMLRHSRAGVPLEVMGLMLGEFVDDYTINVVDVFAMPQSGTGVSVEAVDPVFQQKMIELLGRTGRKEMVVGWYHSHPGFGCWLSATDVNTQQSFEALAERAVAVVVDPIQSTKGKVVIDAFRSTGNSMAMFGSRLSPTSEARQTTSNLGDLVKASVMARVQGLGSSYYSLPISYRMSGNDQKMLQCMHKKDWAAGLIIHNYERHEKCNLDNTKEMLKMINLFTKETLGTMELSKKDAELRSMGRINPKRRVTEIARTILDENIVQMMRGMLSTDAFK
ncbi:26S proteasome non-ATPase regulatory subunit 14 [Aphelenchoides avenae]|nr:26S proteasome non-ATPase regulatory subunit 14 [Aphelenchus avenae]